MEAGYRHIDTAYNYLNEDAIGEVLQQWIQSGKVKREELFIVTKVRQFYLLWKIAGKGVYRTEIFCVHLAANDWESSRRR